MNMTTTAATPTTSRALTTEIHDGIAVVTFDLPNEPVNKFSTSVTEEFDALIERLGTIRACAPPC